MKDCDCKMFSGIVFVNKLLYRKIRGSEVQAIHIIKDPENYLF